MNKAVGTLSALIISMMILGCGNSVDNKQMTLDIAGGQRQGVYSGEVSNDIPNGKGKFSVKVDPSQGVNWIYEGGFKDGHFDGQGKLSLANGITREGTFKNDQLEGKGKIYNKEGIMFEGEFKNGMPQLPTSGLNEAVSYADWTYQVTGVETATTVGNNVPKGVFAIVHMHVTNNSNQARQFAPMVYPYILQDETGSTFPMNTQVMLAHRLANLSQDWSLSQINPGQSTDLVLIFDVNHGMKNVMLIPEKGYWQAPRINIGNID